MTDTFIPLGTAAADVVAKLAGKIGGKGRITKPGLYPDISSTDYFDDPCPLPSFSQSIGKVILAHSPAHARVKHPRLAPTGDDVDEEVEKYVKAQAIGNAAHLLMLRRGKVLEIFDAPNWNATGMGKGAKTQLHADRDAAIAAGKTPILEHHFAVAEAMVARARQIIAEHGFADDWSADAGQAEVMIAWEEDGTWFRSLVDWLLRPTKSGARVVYDYKSTGLSVAPSNLSKLMGDAGWPVQGAMHERGLTVLEPQCAGRLIHRFVAQEQFPPYEVTISDLPESTMVMGRKLLGRAVSKWQHAMRTNRWAGYPRVVQQPTYPEWQENRILEAEYAEFEDQQRGRREPVADDHFYAG